MRGPIRFLIAPLEWVLYNARFALVPLYLAVLVKMGEFVYDAALFTIGKANVEVLEGDTLGLLVLVDATMVANVVYLIVCGSYLIYVKSWFYDGVNGDEKQRPSALDHLTPAVLKKHISGSLATISAVSLIRIMLEKVELSTNLWVMLVTIHLLFLVGFWIFWKASHDLHPAKDTH